MISLVEGLISVTSGELEDQILLPSVNIAGIEWLFDTGVSTPLLNTVWE